MRENKTRERLFCAKRALCLQNQTKNLLVLLLPCIRMLVISSIDFDTWRGALFLAKYQSIDASNPQHFNEIEEQLLNLLQICQIFHNSEHFVR